MKKRTVFLTSLLVVLSMVFMGCGEKPGKEADPDPITVTFEVNGGSAIEAVEVGEDGLVDMPADPTKEGYTFDGWFSDEALTTAFDETVEITESITIYAKWTVITYTVKYDSQGGSKVDSATVEYKKTATKPADPTLDGKHFAGWYTDKECTKVFEFTTEITADVTLYAKWTTDPVYSVTIKYNITGEDDGDVKATKDKEYIIAAPSKTRDGYTVVWYSDEKCTTEFDFTKPVSADATIYAKWTVIEYTITYNLDEGTNDSTNPAKYTIESDTITFADATKDGCSFEGWFTDSAKTAQITKIEKGTTGNITLYAKWGEAGATYEYTYEPGSTGVALPFNAGGDNYQGYVTGVIPDNVILKKGDVVKLTIKGSSTIAIPSLQVALVDNAEDTGSGWGWNVMTGYPEVASSLAAQTPFEKTVEIKIINNQTGTGANAHKVVFMAPKDTGDGLILYPKVHDYNSKEVTIYEPETPDVFENSGYDCAALIKDACNTLKAGDVLTFYYTITDPSVGWAQLQLKSGYSAASIPGVKAAGGNKWDQFNIDLNSTSFSYEITAEDMATFLPWVSEEDEGNGNMLRISGHNITLTKVTKK